MSESLGAQERGCGKRVKGGVYAEVPLSPFGTPWEEFLMEPPVPVEDFQVRITPVGVTLIEHAGVTHVVDWVGSQHYPNVADFVEEMKRLGCSRRLPSSLDFSRITKDSRLLLVHAGALVTNWYTLYANQKGAPITCPKRSPTHDVERLAFGKGGEPETFCVGAWWHDLERGQPYNPEGTGNKRAVVRTLANGATYNGFERVAGSMRRAAVFASLPISRIAVVRDPDGGAHVTAQEKAARAGVPVIVEDE